MPKWDLLVSRLAAMNDRDETRGEEMSERMVVGEMGEGQREEEQTSARVGGMKRD